MFLTQKSESLTNKNLFLRFRKLTWNTVLNKYTVFASNAYLSHGHRYIDLIPAKQFPVKCLIWTTQQHSKRVVLIPFQQHNTGKPFTTFTTLKEYDTQCEITSQGTDLRG